jgi:hypothetical protein
MALRTQGQKPSIIDTPDPTARVTHPDPRRWRIHGERVAAEDRPLPRIVRRNVLIDAKGGVVNHPEHPRAVTYCGNIALRHLKSVTGG